MLVGYRALGLSTVQTGLIGLGAVIGHGYPLYFHFKGGRGAVYFSAGRIFQITKEYRKKRDQ